MAGSSIRTWVQIPRTHKMLHMVTCVPVDSALEGRANDGRIAGLAGHQANSKFSERFSLKDKVESD